MAVPQNFRSSLNGFNREDVVHYIEFLNAKHTQELNLLRSEIEFLKEQPAPAPSCGDGAQSELQAEHDALSVRCAQLEADLEQAKAAREGELQSLREQVRSLEEKLAAAPQSPVSGQPLVASPVEKELEAYRRAERTERMARERSEQVYRTTNGVLADATIRVDEAADQLSQITELVQQQLSQLQEAVAGSKAALADAAAILYTIRPGEGD